MANVSKGWAIGDTVYVHYIGSIQNQFLPVSRVVKDCTVNSSGNESVVTFTTGESVIDGATVTVYTSQALCAAGIVTWMIAQSVAVCTLDSTTSVASTSGQASTTLGRVS